MSHLRVRNMAVVLRGGTVNIVSAPLLVPCEGPVANTVFAYSLCNDIVLTLGIALGAVLSNTAVSESAIALLTARSLVESVN